MVIKDKIYRIYRRLRNFCYYILSKNKRAQLNILDIDETIDYIVRHECSVARYGDGELDYVLAHLGVTVPSINFQKYDPVLAKSLYRILVDSNTVNNFRIGLPCCLSHGVFRFRWADMRYWQYYTANHLDYLLKILPNETEFIDAFFTRFYLPWRNKKAVNSRIQKIKRIWDDRDILIIEGEKSRLGVGNDIFANTRSIKRIIAPSQNAFSFFSEILKSSVDKLSNYSSKPIVLIALGPTATILAYEIAKRGYQAIDIGHLDIEYEWMRIRAKEKMQIKGKFVNEVKGGETVDEVTDKTYMDQIIAKIL